MNSHHLFDFFFSFKVLLMKKEYNRNTKITMGAYVFGNEIGVRKFPYSSDMSVDPETYGYLKKSGYSEVHAAGEVWSTGSSAR
jgi:extracellular elastinolytic metalloproteinase